MKKPTIKSLQAEVKRLQDAVSHNETRYYQMMNERDAAAKRAGELREERDSAHLALNSARGAVVEYMLATNEPVTSQDQERLVRLQQCIAYAQTPSRPY